MDKFKLFRKGWWILHLLALFLVFWLGHAVKF
jgi:hypothetical protein